MVQCIKLGHEAEGLARPPFPNELGQRIWQNVSKEGWKQWLAHSTMLINEYRIDLQSKEGTKFLLEQAEKFFFGGEVAQASGYVPPKEGGDAKDAHGRAPGDAHYGHDHAHDEPHGGHGHGHDKK
jgi:Fe-S cluster biosynthesis and repair protein YggX